jgi:hypothetical protein
MTLLEEDVRNVRIEPVDIILSSSVYEHVEDVEGITRALAVLTKADGLHIHYIDLRDHFFKYPFEMLRFSDGTWRNWLNPSSNHNRYRLWNYRRAFEAFFEKVEIEILSSEVEAFRKFSLIFFLNLSVETMEEDAAATIRVMASKPRIDLISFPRLAVKCRKPCNCNKLKELPLCPLIFPFNLVMDFHMKDSFPRTM